MTKVSKIEWDQVEERDSISQHSISTHDKWQKFPEYNETQ